MPVTPETKFERHISISSQDSSILAELSRQCDLSNAELKQAIAKGALWLSRNQHTQRIRRLKKKLKTGDQLHFYFNKAVLEQSVSQAVLIEDCQDYSIWFKPYGMLSQGSKWSDHCTIARFVQTQLTPERPVFIVHRLDRAATGLIMLAHSKKAARALSALFERHELEKHYQIIVHGNQGLKPQPDIITEPIDNKAAKSTMKCLDYDADANLSLVEVKIDSGRKHQIRKHAAGAALPVVGDRLYGPTDKSYGEKLNLQLCAVSLKFTCPLTGQVRSFSLSEEYRPQLKQAIKLLATNQNK